MDETLHPALLPAGMRDTLPPEAATEADIIGRLVGCLAAHGYERVDPPLLEFESSLLSGPGTAVAQETFRLMDPVSHRMIAVRADMTLQIARIAMSRLSRRPRPLRLCYAGQVLRVRGNQLRPERQFGQIGVELIGTDAPAADAEVIELAAEAMFAVGVEGLSVDLTLPRLVPIVLAALTGEERPGPGLRAALDRKDMGAITAAGGAVAPVMTALAAAAGPARTALARLSAIDLPEAARPEIARLAEIVALVGATWPELAMTVDPVENRGFEYHTGVSFSFFARGSRNELGRGGRYIAALAPDQGAGDETDRPTEPATGFTLYAEPLFRAVPPPPPPAPRLYLPFGTARAIGERWRRDGWVTLAGLSAVADDAGEARRLGCSHCLEGNRAEPV